MIAFECERCGKCCTGDAWLRNLIRLSDVEKWKEQGRDDILKYVCTCCNRLVDPDKGNAPWTKKNCPFLEFTDSKSRCRIYEARPHVCRNFPVRKCDNPKCSEKIHIHSWLWRGNCKASKEFRKDIIRALESQIEI